MIVIEHGFKYKFNFFSECPAQAIIFKREIRLIHQIYKKKTLI